MSFEIIGKTNYAPLNTQIDADRDYRDLAGVMNGLDACGCGGGMPQYIIPPGGSGFIPPGMQGFESTTALRALDVLVVGGGLFWLWRRLRNKQAW